MPNYKIFEINFICSNHSKKSFQNTRYQYNLHPETVKYIIFKCPKLNPDSTYEEVLEAILAIYKSLEKVPLSITVRERAES